MVINYFFAIKKSFVTAKIKILINFILTITNILYNPQQKFLRMTLYFFKYYSFGGIRVFSYTEVRGAASICFVTVDIEGSASAFVCRRILHHNYCRYGMVFVVME